MSQLNSTPFPSPIECWRCNSAVFKVRRKLTPSGTEQYRWQCQNCGAAVGNALKKSPLENLANNSGKEIPVFDDALEKAHTHIKLVRADNISNAQRLKGDQDKAQHKAFRENYMASPRWRNLRQLVIARCNNRCEGCGQSAVAHVHHKTYDHLGDELLFELVGLCAECHEKAHSKIALWREISSLAARNLK